MAVAGMALAGGQTVRISGLWDSCGIAYLVHDIIEDVGGGRLAERDEI